MIHLPNAVLLDLDDTILTDTVDAFDSWRTACFAARSDAKALDPVAVHRAIGRARSWYWSDPVRHRQGRLDPDAAARVVAAHALRSLSIDDLPLAHAIAARYRHEREARVHPFPGAIETLLWLRERGCRLALITNGNAMLQRRKIARFGIGDLFGAILIEEETGIGKPDPRVYRRALEALGARPDQAWMVGDHLEFDVGQPQRMGIGGVWIDIYGTGVPVDAAVKPDRIVRTLAELQQL